MESLKSLVVNFFDKLGCKITNEGYLLIEEVPEDFESVYSKKGPYKFSFEKEIEGTKFIDESSYLLTAISNYLKNKAKTTLLKISFGEELKDELSKYVDFGNYEITSVSKTHKNDIILKLTFISSLQYLNETKKVINTIYLHDEGIIDNFDIENYATSEGEASEIEGLSIDKEIDVAKEKVRELIKDKIDIASTNLFYSLDKSKKRIDEHYSELSREVEEEIKKNEEKISQLNIDREEGYLEKVKKLRETISELRGKIDPVAVQKEKDYHYEDERRKHSLNISSNILNKSIIYYPIYNLSLNLGFKESSKVINFVFNPLTKRVYDLKCEGCGNDVRKINLCIDNHLMCSNCSVSCSSCFNESCKKCLEKSCGVCSNNICSRCVRKCHKCLGVYCSSHVREDFMEGREICNKCSEVCSGCSKATLKEYFRKIDGRNLCPKCVGMEIRFE